MEMKELRKQSAQDLGEQLLELRREQFNLRMQKATGQLSNTANLPKVRRNIARLRTIMNQKSG